MAKVAKGSQGKRGGAKPGERRGGRKKGTKNKKNAETVAKIEASGLTPLEFMLDVLRDGAAETAVRFEAAKAAAPYVHPRLAAVEHTGQGGGPIRQDMTWDIHLHRPE